MALKRCTYDRNVECDDCQRCFKEKQTSHLKVATQHLKEKGE